MTGLRLDKLPQELIDQIASEAVVPWDWIERHYSREYRLSDLSHLSRTCKRLYEACAPTLFRRATFHWSDRELLRFLQALISKPYLAKYVRVFKAAGGGGGGNETAALNKVAEEVLECDPAARFLLQEVPRRLGDVVAVLALKILPDLAALTTSPAVMQLLTRLPEEQRLRGSSVTTLQVVRNDSLYGDDSYCEDMFDWKQAFQPGKTPAALQSLRLEHRGCQAPRLQGDHVHSQLDPGNVHTAASLRQLHLDNWLPSIGDERDCVPRLMGTLDKCTGLTHLTFMNDDALMKPMLDSICNSTVLTTNLQRLEIGMWSAQVPLDAYTLSQLSRFTLVTSLTLPWIYIDGDFPSESTIWPPSLESLTVSVDADADLEAFSLLTMIQAREISLPATMQDITFRWFLTSHRISSILDMIDFSRDLHEDLAPSGIRLLHGLPTLHDERYACPPTMSTDVERE